jgi:hypothetical protein
LGEGAACPVAAYADAGFTCQRPSDGGSDIDGLICALQTTVNIDANRPIEFIEPGPVDVILLASAGDSMFGIDPCIAVTPSWRSDPSALRVRGFNSMVFSLDSGPVSDESFYCPAAYREAGTLDFIGASARPDECLLRPAAVLSTKPGDKNPNDEFQVNALNRGTNNYLAALEDLFEIYPTLGRQGDLHVVLFTDGPLAEEDLRENAATGTTYESVLAQAQAIGATIHVQQLAAGRAGRHEFDAVAVALWVLRRDDRLARGVLVHEFSELVLRLLRSNLRFRTTFFFVFLLILCCCKLVIIFAQDFLLFFLLLFHRRFLMTLSR